MCELRAMRCSLILGGAGPEVCLPIRWTGHGWVRWEFKSILMPWEFSTKKVTQLSVLPVNPASCTRPHSELLYSYAGVQARNFFKV